MLRAQFIIIVILAILSSSLKIFVLRREMEKQYTIEISQLVSLQSDIPIYKEKGKHSFFKEIN